MKFHLLYPGPALLVLLVLAAVASAGDEREQEYNGFAIEPAAIAVDEILRGGPPRDGIPSLDSPKSMSVELAPWRDAELVMGVVQGTEAAAYPLAILTWHELVNDELGGVPILISYCPLCGTGIVFDRRVAPGDVRDFGVSGLLYRSDLLMYDRQTESLWSQISARAVTGKAIGTELNLVRSHIMTWGEWKKRHPKTRVLSPETGHRRPYDESPYGEYVLSEELLFPAPQDARYHPKMPTIGLRNGKGEARAYPAAEVMASGGRVEDRFSGATVSVEYDPDAQVFRVEAPDEIDVIEGFWFAWMAFHPQSGVYQAP